MAFPTASDLRRASVEHISAACLIFILAITGVGLFIWMAFDGWSDLVGVSVGVLFIVLAALQVVFTVGWQIATKRHKLGYDPTCQVSATEMEREVAM